MREHNCQFQIRLADHLIQVSALYESTKWFCRDYLIEDSAKVQNTDSSFRGSAVKIDFSIEMNPEDIDYERERSAREDILEGIPVRCFSDEYLEKLAVYRKIAEQMIDYDTLLVHGSALAMDDEGYLFTAKSGMGKSTHARLWRELFGERVQMVNDDKPLLRIAGQKDAGQESRGQRNVEHGVIVYGTPWDGKHHLSSNISVPLKAICILERSGTNAIEPLTKREAFPMLMQQSYRSEDAGRMVKMLELADTLADSVKWYVLRCNMEPEAAQVAYHGMNPDS